MASKYKKKEIETREWVLKHPLTEEQEALASSDKKSCVGESVAGSGKSTTMLEATTRRMKSLDGKAAIVMFSKSLQEEMAVYASKNLDITTKHALGYRSFYMNGRRPYVDKNKDVGIIMNELKFDPSKESDPKARRQQWAMLFAMVDLVDKMRVRMADPRSIDAAVQVNSQYGCGVDDMHMALDLLRISTEKGLSGHIGFAEMNYIPVIAGWETPKYDFLCLDEAQDFSPMDELFLSKCIGVDALLRLIGDRRQSILGYAGADTAMIDKLTNKFSAEVFPISVTFRCPHAVVNAITSLGFHKDFKAWGQAKDGEFNPDASYDIFDYANGTMILSRRNATLVPYAIKAHKAGRTVSVLGGGIEFQLLGILKHCQSVTISGLFTEVSEEHERKVSRLVQTGAKQSAIDFINDVYDTLTSIINECTQVAAVTNMINELFRPKKESIIYSSIHRSKGREADHVVILDSTRMTLDFSRLNEEEVQQEINLQYVACSRAKHRLDFIK